MQIKPRAYRLPDAPIALRWLPGEPFTAHFCNVFHVFAPVLERGFIQVYTAALPQIHDESLRAATRGLIGQEAMHARAHGQIVAAMRAEGIEPAAFEAECERIWERLAGAGTSLRWQLAVGAAGEHMTGVIGAWILDRGEALAAAGADPAMLDLLRWHGAEEIEHGSVAFDVLAHVAGRWAYPLRLAALALVAPALGWIWLRGTPFLLAADPQTGARRFGTRDWLDAMQRGLLPGPRFLGAIARYLDPRFHPADPAEVERALAVLAGSAGVRAAAR